jgi:sugar-specific transcriptional regulator TrmB
MYQPLSDDYNELMIAGRVAVSEVFMQLTTVNQLSSSQERELCLAMCGALKPICDCIAVVEHQTDNKISMVRDTITNIGNTICIEIKMRQDVGDQKYPTSEQQITRSNSNMITISNSIVSEYIRQLLDKQQESCPIRMTRQSSVTVISKQTKRVTFCVKIAQIKTYIINEDGSSDDTLFTISYRY